MVGTHRIIGPKDSVRTLLFVHGFPDDSSTFEDLATKYAARGYRCVLVDMPYYTAQTSDNQPYFGYDMTGIADYLHGIVDATKVDGSLTLVAHDLGVVYCQWLLAKYPADAVATVMIDVGWGMNIGVDDHLPMDREVLKNLFFYGKEYQYIFISLWLLNRMPTTSGLLDQVQSTFSDVLPFNFTDGTGQGYPVRPESAYSYFYVP